MFAVAKRGMATTPGLFYTTSHRTGMSGQGSAGSMGSTCLYLSCTLCY